MYNSITDLSLLIVLFVGFILFVVGIQSMFRNLATLRKQDPVKVVMFMAGVVLLFTSVMVKQSVITKRWDNAVNENFTFYVDGSPVDPTAVEYKNYAIAYDEDAKTAKLSKPSSPIVLFFITGV